MEWIDATGPGSMNYRQLYSNPHDTCNSQSINNMGKFISLVHMTRKSSFKECTVIIFFGQPCDIINKLYSLLKLGCNNVVCN